MDEKLADFADGAPYDIVFLGSSQTFRHINPAVIETGLAQCNLDQTVYNFGIPALREPEMRYVANALLDAPERPQLVVVQNPIRAETVFSNMMSERGRFFRGGDAVGDALNDVQCYTGRRRGQARSLFNNLRVILAEAMGLGRLAQRTLPQDPADALDYDDRYRINDGYWPVDQDPSDHVVARLTGSPMTQGVIDAGLRGEGFVPSQASANCRAAQLSETFAELEAGGVQVAYFVSPDPKNIAHDKIVTGAVAAAQPDLPILDFNSAKAAEAFFVQDYWFDGSHMNGAGADALSAAIADRLCSFLATGEG